MLFDMNNLREFIPVKIVWLRTVTDSIEYKPETATADCLALAKATTVTFPTPFLIHDRCFTAFGAKIAKLKFS